jgi:hypothetical protein
MAMSDPDRKRLWGKAANRCAICRTELSRESEAGDDEALIGEEAHIIGSKPGAARYEPLEPTVRDGYANRILLCRNDHREVDQLVLRWPVEELRRVKERHEVLMAARTADPPGPTAVPVKLILGGRDLIKLVAGAEAYHTDWEEFASDEETEVGRALLQNAVDWGEIADEIGVAGQIDGAKNLGEQINEALGLGLMLYGGTIPTWWGTGEQRVRLECAVLWLRRAENVAREHHEADASEPPASPVDASSDPTS